VDFGWAAWIALVPLLFCVKDVGFWNGFRRGLWFGFVFFLLNLSWLYQFIENWTHSAILGAIPWLVLAVIQGLYMALFAGLVAFACRKFRLGLLLAPPVWAAVEHFRSNWPAGGFAWSQLSYSQWQHPLLLQPAGWAGTHFLAFVIVLVNVGIVYAIGEPKTRKVGYAIGGAMAVTLVASMIPFLDQTPGKLLKVAAAQPSFNVATGDLAEWLPSFMEFRTAVLHRAAAEGVQLVVFPEGYQPMPPLDAETAPAAYTITGQRQSGRRNLQTAYGVTPGDPSFRMRDKTRLVIFGEYVPWRDSLPFLDAFKVPGGDVDAGVGGPPLWVGGLSVGSAICYESMFGEVFRGQAEEGVDVLAVMTLDDWYPDAEKYQHAAAAVVRAVENGKPLIHSASNGVTMIVNRRGQIISMLPLRVRDVLVAEVDTTDSKPTPIGRWFPFACYGAIVAVLWPDRKRDP